MTETWQELATRKRSAEDGVIARYRRMLLGGEEPGAGREAPRETPFGPASHLFGAMYVASVDRRSAWPETQIVLKMFLDFAPERAAIVTWPLWIPENWDEDAPFYNDVFWVNIGEAVTKRFRKRLAEQPGPILYFLWRTEVDFDNPPAPGDPPRELLAARVELERIRSQW